MNTRRKVEAIENEETYVINVLRALHLAKAAWAEINKGTTAC